MKLVKDTKHIKLPKASGTVKGALRRAGVHAQKQGWTRVIIIGEGKNDCQSVYSRVDNYTALGMLVCEIGMIQKDLLV